MKMCEGIVSELNGIDLGDARLNARARIVLESLASDTEASINAVSKGWSQTKAAYRFFDNTKVEPEKVMDPHRAATRERARAEPVVLVIQDTTELDYTDYRPEGVGCLTAEDRFGFYAHVSLAATPAKLALGVVDHEFYSRTPETLGKRRERRALPIEDKESYRWLEGYDEACLLANECPATQVISIADREADIFEIYVKAEPEPGTKKADYIIRSDGDRSTPSATSRRGRTPTPKWPPRLSNRHYGDGTRSTSCRRRNAQPAKPMSKFEPNRSRSNHRTGVPVWVP
jgi:hypothetical protein